MKGDIEERALGHNIQTVILASWSERKGSFVGKKEAGHSLRRKGERNRQQWRGPELDGCRDMSIF